MIEDTVVCVVETKVTFSIRQRISYEVVRSFSNKNKGGWAFQAGVGVVVATCDSEENAKRVINALAAKE